MRKFLSLAAVAVAVSTLGGCWWGPPPGYGGGGYRDHGGGYGPRGDVVVPGAAHQA